MFVNSRIVDSDLEEFRRLMRLSKARAVGDENWSHERAVYAWGLALGVRRGWDAGNQLPARVRLWFDPLMGPAAPRAVLRVRPPRPKGIDPDLSETEESVYQMFRGAVSEAVVDRWAIVRACFNFGLNRGWVQGWAAFYGVQIKTLPEWAGGNRPPDPFLDQENKRLRVRVEQLEKEAQTIHWDVERLRAENTAARDCLHNLRLILGLVGGGLGQADLEEINGVLGDWGLQEHPRLVGKLKLDQSAATLRKAYHEEFPDGLPQEKVA